MTTRARLRRQDPLTQPLLPRAALERIAADVVLLPGAASAAAAALLAALDPVIAAAPWRHMTTPGGARMSVAMTNCGQVGWVSDRRGYRYDAIDPDSGLAWPRMPEALRALATHAAATAGFDGFEPDACLVNRYAPGTRLSLHQDRNERDLAAPVVSVSLGDDAIFRIGGAAWRGPAKSLKLGSGDVVMFGGPARLAYHGIDRILPGTSTLIPGGGRINLTLRRVT